jgi:hypothetical protein
MNMVYIVMMEGWGYVKPIRTFYSSDNADQCVLALTLAKEDDKTNYYVVSMIVE